MKIKTVHIGRCSEFDEAVNELLSEGWTLMKIETASNNGHVAYLSKDE